MNGLFIFFLHHKNSKEEQILRLTNISKMKKTEGQSCHVIGKNKQNRIKKRPHKQNEKLNSNLEGKSKIYDQKTRLISIKYKEFISIDRSMTQ